MKTEDLVSLLATGVDAEKLQAPVRRYTVAVLGGTAVATLLVAELLGAVAKLPENVNIAA